MLKTIKETFSNKERTKLIEELWLNLDKDEKSKYSEGFHEYRFIQESIYNYYHKSSEYAASVMIVTLGIIVSVTVFLETFYHNNDAPMWGELFRFLWISSGVFLLVLFFVFMCSIDKKEEKKFEEHYNHIIDVIHKDFGEKYDLFLGIESKHQEENKDDTKSYLVVVKEIENTSENNK